MKVRDVMTAGVVTAAPADTIRDVARRMSEVDTGVIPVVQGGVVTGLITDRDIVLRVVAEDGDPHAPVSQYMTETVETCQADDPLREASRKMADLQIRRLIVLENQTFVGILSLGDVAREVRGSAAVALEEISDPGDQPA
jgi:CBS domain-containing protein